MTGNPIPNRNSESMRKLEKFDHIKRLLWSESTSHCRNKFPLNTAIASGNWFFHTFGVDFSQCIIQCVCVCMCVCAELIAYEHRIFLINTQSGHKYIHEDWFCFFLRHYHPFVGYLKPKPVWDCKKEYIFFVSIYWIKYIQHWFFRSRFFNLLENMRKIWFHTITSSTI